jgi:hypothetical protein
MFSALARKRPSMSTADAVGFVYPLMTGLWPGKASIRLTACRHKDHCPGDWHYPSEKWHPMPTGHV